MPRSNRSCEHLITAILWSAPAERSGDGALAYPARSPDTKAVSRFACHRTPHVRTTKVSVAVSRCSRRREHLITAILWSAPAERSGDGALAYLVRSPDTKAVSRFACHRTPHVRTTKV